MGRHRLWAGGTQGSETSQYLQEGILREGRNSVTVGCTGSASRTVRQVPKLLRKGTLMGLPVTNRRKVGMTSSPHGPYRWGYTRHTMAGTEGCQPARGS